MLNYSTVAPLKPHLAANKTNIIDVLGDIGNDVHGLAFNLSAIADQGFVIEPAQIESLSDMVFLIDCALCEVLDYMKSADSKTESAEGVS